MMLKTRESFIDDWEDLVGPGGLKPLAQKGLISDGNAALDGLLAPEEEAFKNDLERETGIKAFLGDKILSMAIHELAASLRISEKGAARLTQFLVSDEVGGIIASHHGLLHRIKISPSSELEMRLEGSKPSDYLEIDLGNIPFENPEEFRDHIATKVGEAREYLRPLLLDEMGYPSVLSLFFMMHPNARAFLHEVKLPSPLEPMNQSSVSGSVQVGKQKYRLDAIGREPFDALDNYFRAATAEFLGLAQRRFARYTEADGEKRKLASAGSVGTSRRKSKQKLAGDYKALRKEKERIPERVKRVVGKEILGITIVSEEQAQVLFDAHKRESNRFQMLGAKSIELALALEEVRVDPDGVLASDCHDARTHFFEHRLGQLLARHHKKSPEFRSAMRTLTSNGNFSPKRFDFKSFFTTLVGILHAEKGYAHAEAYIEDFLSGRGGEGRFKTNDFCPEMRKRISPQDHRRNIKRSRSWRL